MNIIDLLSNLITITGNKVADGVLLAIIGAISFTIAFDVVGFIYRLIKPPDKEAMSELHWWVRIMAFLGLSALFIAIAKFFSWFFSSIWWIVALVCIGVAIAIYITVYFIRKRKKNSSKSDEQPVPEEEAEDAEELLVKDGGRCPLCGGKLVKREGPFGPFWGCENFPKTGCKYTKDV